MGMALRMRGSGLLGQTRRELGMASSFGQEAHAKSFEDSISVTVRDGRKALF
jgi:hypothetical protein